MKYMGSKAKIASEILPFIHSYIAMNNIDTYIEPFVGGANMIDKVQCTYKFGYDKNKYLIALFKHIQEGGELPEDVSREQYADAKAHYRAKDDYYPDWYLAAVGFLAGFNGRFFDGDYAQPGYDKEAYRDYYQEAKRNILNQMRLLGDTQFNSGDYKELNPSNALVYADPPYAGTKGYLSVTKEFNHKEFWDIMREWSKNNIVLISEETAPEDFDVLWEQEVTRTIKANDKSKATEKLFIHKSLNQNNIGFDF